MGQTSSTLGADSAPAQPQPMIMRIEGGCKDEGFPGAVGTGTVLFTDDMTGSEKIYVRRLLEDPRPTSNRVELTALILALERAVEKSGRPWSEHRVELHIMSGSRYLHGCVGVSAKDWKRKIRRHGISSSKNLRPDNYQLLQKLYKLECQLTPVDITYIWDWEYTRLGNDLDLALRKAISDTARAVEEGDTSSPLDYGYVNSGFNTRPIPPRQTRSDSRKEKRKEDIKELAKGRKQKRKRGAEGRVEGRDTTDHTSKKRKRTGSSPAPSQRNDVGLCAPSASIVNVAEASHISPTIVEISDSSDPAPSLNSLFDWELVDKGMGARKT